MTTRIGSLAVSLSLDAENFNGSMAQVDRNLRTMGSELKATKALGTDYGKSLDGLKSKKDILGRSIEASSIKLGEERKKYDELVSSGKASEAQLERQAKKVNDAQAGYNRLATELDEVDKALKTQSSSWTQYGDKMTAAGTKLKSVGDGMKNVGKDLSMKVTAPIFAMGAAAFKMAVDYESSFAGVRKTVSMTESEFDKLSGGIRNLAKEIPAAATEIAGVAEAAGQLGIENDAILGFTRVMVDMGVATNMSSDQAATALARFANITQMSQSDFDKLGSTIVDLGNNLATTESEIVEMGLRLAGAGKQVGMTEAQIMSFAGALSSVGIEAEAGGSAFSKVMINMQLATETGGKKLEDFAKVAGMSARDFKKAFEEDAATAMISFIKGLADAESQGKSAIGMLDDMGIKEVRLRDSLLRAAGASDVFTESLEIGTNAWEENNALTNEAEERYKTTASQMKILWNQITDIGISIGDILIPKVTALMDKISPLIDKFGNMSSESQNMIIALAGIAAAIGPVLVVGGSLMAGLGGLVTVTGAASTALGLGGTGLGATLLGLALPIGLTVAAIGGLGLGFLALDNYMDKPIIKSDIFAGEISKATEAAVGSYMDLNEKATAELNALAWSQGEITDEVAASMTEKYREMGDMVLTAMKEKHAEQLASQQKMFDDSNVLTEEEEQKQMQKLAEAQLREQEAHTKAEARKLEIITLANKEKRKTTDEENAELARLNERSQKEAVKVLTESQEEQKTILANMKEQKGVIRAEEAADAIKISKEKKEKVVEEAEKTFEETVKTATESAATLGGISQEDAKAIIKEAEFKRDKVVAEAEDMHYEVIKEARAQSGNHANAVNEETGEVLSGWDRMYNGVVKAVNWITELFGGKQFKVKGKVAPNARQKMKGSQMTASYAKGTMHGNHRGGPAIVGEEGPELASIPGLGMTMVGTGGPELIGDLPAGSAILPNKQTENILKQYGFPGYAKGVGDWGIFDLISKGATGAWDYLKDKFNVSNSVLPDMFINMAGDVTGSIAKMATDYIKNLFSKNDEEGNGPVSFGNLRKTSGFGMRFHPIHKVWRLHAGDDYAGPVGTAIKSTTGGNVIHAGRMGGYGNMVRVKNGAYTYTYAHLSRIMTSLGAAVNKGNVIGALGNTGDSTGPHLHYEVRKNGTPIRPGAYADGGVITKEQLAWVGEGNKEEVIIPTGDPSKRENAIKLFEIAGAKLGLHGRKVNPVSLPAPRPHTRNEAQLSDARKLLVIENKEANEEIAAINKKANEEAAQLAKRAAEDIRLIHAKAKAAKRKLTAAESIRIRRIEEDSAKKIKNIHTKAAVNVSKITKSAQADRIGDLNNYINDKRRLEQISLQEEVGIWQESLKYFKNGTDEKREALLSLRDAKRAVDKERLDDGLAYIDEKRSQGKISLADELRLLNQLEKTFDNIKGNSKFEAVQQRKADVVQQVNTKVESLNREFLAKTIQINDDYIAESTRMLDEVERAVDARESTIRSYTSLFDGFEVGEPVMAIDLMKNLNEQVIGLQNWQITIADLSSKAIDEGLLEELRQMGPKALPELKALNNMTNDQLTAYSNLYQQKSAIARKQAEAELVGMRKDTEKRIEEMRKAADKELSVMEREWVSKVKAITTETDVVLKTLKDVGINAGKGLMEGLSDMEGPLVGKATSIANNIKKAMEKAFDINSPSHWMRDHIAGNMGAGFIVGVDKMKRGMLRATEKMTGWMTPGIPQFAEFSVPDYSHGRESGSFVSQSVPQQPQVIHIQPAPVYLDGREIGEVVFDTVDRIHAGNYSATAYMRGGRS